MQVFIKFTYRLLFYNALVSDYEEAFYPVKEPVLADVIKLRMYEMGVWCLFW